MVVSSRPEALELARTLAARLVPLAPGLPAFTRETEYVGLRNDDEYAFFEGDICSTDTGRTSKNEAPHAGHCTSVNFTMSTAAPSVGTGTVMRGSDSQYRSNSLRWSAVTGCAARCLAAAMRSADSSGKNAMADTAPARNTIATERRAGRRTSASRSVNAQRGKMAGRPGAPSYNADAIRTG